MTEYRPCHDYDLWVHLTDAEIDAAIQHGAKMRRTSKARKYRQGKGGFGHRPSTDRERMRAQCLGALAEGIVLKACAPDAELTSETFNVADLPGDLQVRSITKEYYGLVVRPDDEPQWKVIGAVIPEGRERISPYRIPGWRNANDARQHPEWIIRPHGGPPIWAVPQEELNDALELISPQADLTALMRLVRRQWSMVL
jgi:hypothetical protein